LENDFSSAIEEIYFSASVEREIKFFILLIKFFNGFFT